MDIKHIVIFDNTKRMTISIDEKGQYVQDITLIHGDKELIEIMNLISHKTIKNAIECLNCQNTNNKYNEQMVNILKCYNKN